MSDAPLSQARLATTLQAVEGQIQLLAQGHDLLKREVSQKADLADHTLVREDASPGGSSAGGGLEATAGQNDGTETKQSAADDDEEDIQASFSGCC